MVDITGSGTIGNDTFEFTGTYTPAEEPPAEPGPSEGYLGTLAELLAQPTAELSDGQRVRVKEYHAGTDTGGGDFVWLASDTTPEDGVFTYGDATQGRWVREGNPGMVRASMAGCLADGTHNNTPAFLRLAEYITDRGGNTVLEFDHLGGVYSYEQHKLSGASRYYGMADIFTFQDLSNITIRGNKARFRLADGTHFGSFDPNDGSIASPTTNFDYANGGGRFLLFEDCDNIDISGVLWDGNVSNHVVGGGFGDTGHQVTEYGLLLHGTADNVVVRDCEFGHSGLDGMSMSVSNQDPLKDHNIAFYNVRCEYNGRQGASITGGSQMLFVGCQFSYTGQDTVESMPKAGVDIEPEGGRYVVGNRFIGCSFHANKGAALLTAVNSPNMEDNQFDNCSFIGTDGTSLYITAATGMVPARFNNCHIKGALSVTGNAQFFGCRFDDEETTEHPNVFTLNYFFENMGDLVSFDNCEIRMTQPRPIWFWGKHIKDCKVFAEWDSDVGAQSVLGVISGESYTGLLEVYDRLTGSTPQPMWNSDAPSVYGYGSIILAEDNGNIT